MRFKIVVSVVLLGVGFVALVFFLGAPKGEQNQSGSEHGETATKQARANILPIASKNGSRTNSGAQTRSMSVTNQELIDARVSRLMEMGSSGEQSDLKEILAELNNPNAEIRKIARESAAIFGDKSAIPFLEDQLLLTEQVAEKKEILDAIEALQLPPLAEVLAMRAAAPANPAKPRTVIQPGEKFPSDIRREQTKALNQERKKQQPQPTRPEAPPRPEPTTP